jgi:very-short-patch-repair endonuclease
VDDYPVNDERLVFGHGQIEKPPVLSFVPADFFYPCQSPPPALIASVSKIKTQIEAHFKKPLARIISENHWRDKTPILSLAKNAGVVRQSLMHLCKVEGLKLRDHKESISIRDTRREKHWAWGRTKKDCRAYALASRRLKNKNPMHDEKLAAKIAESKAVTYRRKLWPQEERFLEIISKKKIGFEMQKPIGRYIIDFFIPDLQLCIEIDSTSKWGGTRWKNSKIKDAWLRSQNFKILRIDKRRLTDLAFIDDILAANNIV